jgi:hypothetical protein
VVPLCLSHNWGPISGTFVFYGLYSYHIRCGEREGVHEHWLTASRSAICFGWIMVPPYGSAEYDPPEIRRFYGHIPNFDLRWMDICYIYGRSRLARYIHDFIFSSNSPMDPWVSSIEPKQRQGSEIPKISRISFLRNTCTSNILLHSA